MRFAGNGSALMLAPSVGGPERKVADIPWVGGPERMGGFWWIAGCPSWTPDSKWLAISTRDSLRDPFAIWLLSVAAEERRRLTQPPAGHSGDLSPRFSPDGRALGFFREIADSSFALYLLPLSRDFRPEREPWQPTTERYGIPGG
jgi:Tol biopolymer transport system component